MTSLCNFLCSRTWQLLWFQTEKYHLHLIAGYLGVKKLLEELEETDLLQWWNPIIAPHSNSASSLEQTILSKCFERQTAWTGL